MSNHSPTLSTLLRQCRWALWLCFALMLITGGLYWLLAHDLQFSRAAETRQGKTDEPKR